MPIASSTDRAWEAFGKTDPYFGVLVENRYRSSNLTEQARDEFFRSGEEHVRAMAETIRRRLGCSDRFRRALDFGCGVGRIAIPLARRADSVTGVDVSDSMLEEAARNCERYGVANITLLKSDDHLTRLEGAYDLIHTYIVLQHLRPRRGRRIISSLFSRIEPAGVGVFHLTYAHQGFKPTWAPRIRKYVPLAGRFINLLAGRPFSAPHMEMNRYDLNWVFRFLQTNGIANLYVTFTNHGGHLGTNLYFQKPG